MNNATKNVLVTGGLGFIGSNFIQTFMAKYSDYKIVNVDSITYAANPANLKTIEDHPNYTFREIDIRDAASLVDLFNEFQFTDVVHFAAESHVDNSIKRPSLFAETNVLGTLNLLEAARHLWMEKPFVFKKSFEDSRFVHVSTDEVYGSLGDTGFFTEETPYAPNSPYSASKASSDMIVRSYFHTYGFQVMTTNCSNNYGPMQHDEKLIPTIIRNIIAGNEIPIYGNGKNIRDWLYVEDHCAAIDSVLHKGKVGETYLIGGNHELTNIQIAELICEHLDRIEPAAESYKNLITFVEDRHGHDFRYAIDATKIRRELNFSPKESFETGISKTIKWYVNKYKGAESHEG